MERGRGKGAQKDLEKENPRDLEKVSGNPAMGQKGRARDPRTGVGSAVAGITFQIAQKIRLTKKDPAKEA